MLDEKQQFIKMTTTPIPRLITTLAIPTMFSMLITSVYNMTDTYFVSQLGTSASAAVGVVFSLMSIIQSVGFTLGMGSSSFISRFLGRKDSASASRYASSAFFAAVVLGLLLTVFGNIFIDPLMLLLGSTKTVLPYARDYAGYILYGAPVMCSVFVLNGILRAEGFATAAMLGTMSGGVINMILDPIFIFNLDMGIAGAAIATLIGQCASLLLVSVFFFTGKSFVKIGLKYLNGPFSALLEIIKNGSPTFCRQGLASVASALIAICAKPYGDAVIAASTIATKLYMMSRSAVIGMGQGFQAAAGYNYGAGKYTRVKKGFWFTMGVGSVLCVILAIFLYFEADTAIALFRADDPVVIETGGRALKYLCMVLPLLSYSSYVNMLLQCLGRSKSAAFLASCRQGVFYIPVIIILSNFFGVTGLILTQPIADFMTFLVSIPFHICFFRSAEGLGRPDKIQPTE